MFIKVNGVELFLVNECASTSIGTSIGTIIGTSICTSIGISTCIRRGVRLLFWCLGNHILIIRP